MTLYLPPSLRHFDKNFKILSSWMDHVPFGYDLVEALRPGITVELGTHEGLSFFTFCQSLVDHHIDGVGYAVDTWEGEKHAGHYDNSVYEKVSDYCREKFPGCSYLMRMQFEEARGHFSDNSIDLLHVDGLHTYEAVSEDFNGWYPKVRPGGIILLHDINARREDMGVWKFWDEIMTQGNDEYFYFNHGYGLGVVRKTGTRETSDSTLLKLMFDSTQEDKELLRAFYIMAAKYNTVKHRAPAVSAGKGK